MDQPVTPSPYLLPSAPIRIPRAMLKAGQRCAVCGEVLGADQDTVLGRGGVVCLGCWVLVQLIKGDEVMATVSYLFKPPAQDVVRDVKTIGQSLGLDLGDGLSYQLAGAIEAMSGYEKAPDIDPAAWIETMIQVAAAGGVTAIEVTQEMYLGCSIDEAELKDAEGAPC